MLVDVVSKNGNLLLSIPVRGDGTLDDRELKFIAGLTKWMDVNGPAIFASRPWKIFGEGQVHAPSSMFNEGKMQYTADDIRFTTKDGKLFVFVLGVPDHDIKVQSLGSSSPLGGPIRQITMLGTQEPIHWSQQASYLLIDKPTSLPGLDTMTFEVSFKN